MDLFNIKKQTLLRILNNQSVLLINATRTDLHNLEQATNDDVRKSIIKTLNIKLNKLNEITNILNQCIDVPNDSE